MNLSLYCMAYPVTSLGPGTRVVLWVAGCPHHCPGCISPEMLDFKAGKKIAVAVLLRRLLKLDAEAISGVTVSGGEPFSQAPALFELFSGLREARPHWNIQVYSGYTMGQLRASGDKRADLLDRVDILVDGLFMREVPQTHAFAGSGNQVIHYLTPRALALQPEMDSVALSQMNYGIGNGTFDMLIGVVQDQSRNAILEQLHEARNP